MALKQLNPSIKNLVLVFAIAQSIAWYYATLAIRQNSLKPTLADKDSTGIAVSVAMGALAGYKLVLSVQ